MAGEDRMALRISAGWLVVPLLGGLLAASWAGAEEPFPVMDVTAIAGQWKGRGGVGAFGDAPSAVVEQSNHPDGTYERVITLDSGQRRVVTGTMTLHPDGSIGCEEKLASGTYRLYNLAGRRVIRGEFRNKTTGATSWTELTEVR
jgi:hypothetical protein